MIHIDLPSSDDNGGRIAGLASRIGFTVFGLLFAAAPTFMIFLMARDVPDIRAASAWTETPCTVLESSSESGGNGAWRLRVRYRYEAGGRTHESGCWTWDDTDESRSVEGIAERDKLLARYAPGASATCWVDPADLAVSLRATPWAFSPWLVLQAEQLGVFEEATVRRAS